MGSATISVDEFQALEAKVLQAVELIKKEREARASAEAERDDKLAELASAQNENARLKVALAEAQAETAGLRDKAASGAAAQTEVETLQRERESVRQRVEKMLAQMDELL
jgi:chromosome segregation ATPase